MAKETDLEALVGRLNATTNKMAADVVTVKSTVVDNEDRLKAEIQALKDQLAGGVPVTQAQLDTLVSKVGSNLDALDSVEAALLSIGATTDNPVPDLPV